MKAEELELQAIRFETGKKLAREINSLVEVCQRIRSSRSVTLYSNYHGGLSSAGYGNTEGKPDWSFGMLEKKEIEETIDLVKKTMLEKLSARISGLQKQFDEL